MSQGSAVPGFLRGRGLSSATGIIPDRLADPEDEEVSIFDARTCHRSPHKPKVAEQDYLDTTILQNKLRSRKGNLQRTPSFIVTVCLDV